MSKFMVKNWKKFQHFKDRRPPWIKLYRDLLDDPDWHELSGDDAKSLVMLWMIASETDGVLPDSRKLAFRLRTSQFETDNLLRRLGSHWLDHIDDVLVSERDQVDIKVISDQHQDDAPETETETETEKNKTTPSASRADFEEFWKIYPKRDGSNPKELAWEKFKIQVKDGADPKAIVRAARKYADECERLKESERKFIKQARYWLSGKVWKDYDVPETKRIDLNPVFEGTPEWDERVKAGHSGITTDIRDPVTQRYRRGWYFKTEGPPGYKTSDEIAA